MPTKLARSFLVRLTFTIGPLTILPTSKEPTKRSTPSSVACGIKSSWSSRHMPPVCVRDKRKRSVPANPIQ